MTHSGKKIHFILLILVAIAYMLSAINPYDRLVWLGQSTPAVLYVLIIVALYPRFRFTAFAYILVFLHVLLLLYGAYYTYSNNSLFNNLAEIFNWQRNYFDRVGHFMQGFVPAFLFKELYLKGAFVKKGRVLLLIVLLSSLGLSAAYELGEFALVKLLDVPIDAVMGTQGDIFDSHWDMLWALIGAGIALFVLGPWHNRLLERERNEGV